LIGLDDKIKRGGFMDEKYMIEGDIVDCICGGWSGGQKLVGRIGKKPLFVSPMTQQRMKKGHGKRVIGNMRI
jgi:hypothetical protein